MFSVVTLLFRSRLLRRATESVGMWERVNTFHWYCKASIRKSIQPPIRIDRFNCVLTVVPYEPGFYLKSIKEVNTRSCGIVLHAGIILI